MTEEVQNILNNIVREVDAIRGYIENPVLGDFIQDEIGHLYELTEMLAGHFPRPDGEINDGDEDVDDQEE